SALVAFGVRQHSRAESISKRARTAPPNRPTSSSAAYADLAKPGFGIAHGTAKHQGSLTSGRAKDRRDRDAARLRPGRRSPSRAAPKFQAEARSYRARTRHSPWW